MTKRRIKLLKCRYCKIERETRDRLRAHEENCNSRSIPIEAPSLTAVVTSIFRIATKHDRLALKDFRDYTVSWAKKNKDLVDIWLGPIVLTRLFQMLRNLIRV